MDAVEAVLLGAGNRGRHTYGHYAQSRPDRLRIAGLAEPEAGRRRRLAEEHALGERAVFEDWRALLDGPQRAAAAIVATGDTLHVEPAVAALERGYHVLLEKPIALGAADCVRVVEAAERAGRLLQISHVLRYTPFYRAVREILDSGRLGRLIAIDMREHVAYWHMTHSFVRGKFRSTDVAAPLLVAKCCHDLDLLVWFADSPALRVSSFGRLTELNAENAPDGAPERCSDGCPVRSECPHDAVRFYADAPEAVAGIWPWSDVSADPSREARLRALESGPYGRCVYRCDNDVCDQQTVSVEFESGLVASFGVQGHASEEMRTIRVTGSRGELRGRLHTGELEITRHGELGVERRTVEADVLGHFGGDTGLLDHFTDVVRREAWDEARTSGRSALESHLLGFAAEESRQLGRLVDLAEFRQRATAAARGPEVAVAG